MSFHPKRHVASLLLNTKHLGSLRNTFYLSILSPWRSLSPPVEVISFDVISLSPFDINFQEGPSGICREWVWSLSHKAKQQVEYDAGRGQESLSEAGVKRMQEQVASCLFCSEIGSTELCALVAPKEFGWTEENKPV